MFTKLQKIQTRFYPPGLNLVYTQVAHSSQINKNIQKELDLYSLDPQAFGDCHIAYPITDPKLRSKIDIIIEKLFKDSQEAISDLKYYQPEIEYALIRIIQKHITLKDNIMNKHYQLKNSINVHQQPLTNCTFNKNGDKFATGSYDRTCRIWQSSTGSLLTSIKGHRNAVFCLDISKFSQKEIIATGSLDHTSRVSTIDGLNLWNFKQHQGEITSVKFNPNGLYLMTSSFDQSIKIWDLEKGKRIMNLNGHTAEVIKLDSNYMGDQVLSCSFDNTAKIWDLRTGAMARNLFGHTAEVNVSKFQYTSEICATASRDGSCIVWDVGSGKKMNKFENHTSEIYDLDFSKRGNYLATCSADMTTNVYSVNTSTSLYSLKGHKGEITRVIFINNGSCLLTTGTDGIGRIWDIENGRNIGLLQGHQDQIFSCDVDYSGQKIITCSKDNVCNLWQVKNDP